MIGLTFVMGRLAHELTRRLISYFVEDMLAQSRQRIQQYNPATADDVRQLDFALIAFSDEVLDELLTLKKYLFRHMWRH